MPDLQTELRTKVLPELDLSTLNFDDEPDTSRPTQASTVKEPVMTTSRATFEFIQAHPGQYTRSEIGRQLAAQGHTLTSVIALITQMMRCGMVGRSDNGGLIPLVDHYSPVRTPAKAKRKPGRPRTRVLPTIAAPVSTPAATKINIDDLKLSEARALYDELKKIFG